MNALRRVWIGYNGLLRNHNLLVQSVQTSVLLGVGDLTAQIFFEAKREKIDLIRTLRFAGIGFFIGPGLMLWYRVLERKIGHSRSWKNTITKVAMDQFIAAPVLLAGFMGTLNVLEGGSLAEYKKKLDKDYMYVLVMNWKVWPAVQLLNFSLVPIQFRVLVVQIVALAWNTFLAWRLH